MVGHVIPAGKDVRAIFFDLYGTLVDIRTDESSPEAWTALCEAVARIDPESPYRTADDVRDAFECAMELRRPASAGEDYEPDMLPAYRALVPGLSGPRRDEAARELAWTFRKASTRMIGLYPSAIDLLRRLGASGRRVALVSNTQACYTRPELDMLGLTPLFDQVVISSEMAVRKPSPAIFRRALEAIGLADDPSRALMVGNDVRCDILGAAGAGIAGAYMRTAISPQDDPPVCERAALSLDGPDYAALMEWLNIPVH